MLNENSATKQIDDIINNASDWQGKMLSKLRTIIISSDPPIVEEVKWKKPSKPSGVPVWSHYGIICVADLLKNAVRLTFPKGAQINDPNKLFNTRLDSKSVRAIDFFIDDLIDSKSLEQIIVEAMNINSLKK